jgi:thymidylate synthase
MFSITAKNVNHAFVDAWFYLRSAGEHSTSRNGEVLVAPGPVLTTYLNPCQRVLFNPRRDANHVFHLMESLWMLAGEQDVGWLKQFSSNISNYAEPDGRMHGAYGWRWRNNWPIDQVDEVINVLRRNPDTRQAVIGMWDPESDLTGEWRDRPCNTHIYFDLRGGRLNMTVCCRSNDILWGCYGANVVHFSVLQEVIAHAVGAPVGVYRQFSNNWHAYSSNPMVRDFLDTPPTEPQDLYETEVSPHPILQGNEKYEYLLDDCVALVDGLTSMRTHFMRDVGVQLRDAYLARKYGGKVNWLSIPKSDWGVAFAQWCQRRTKE